jgi:MerR family transcriptional regulator/heat shock protein HspR
MAKRSDQRRQDDLGVYIISVAAELAGVHPQTLRIYERRGLLRPSRTAGNTRRYSERDIARLRTIPHLTQEEGINLAGVKMIVQLENELDRTRRQLEATARELERTRRRLGEELERRQRESRRGSLVLLRELQRMPWEVTP